MNESCLEVVSVKSLDSEKSGRSGGLPELGQVALMAAMVHSFGKIAVLGPGLLGGSVGLAIQALKLGEVAFWGRSEERLGPVREAGFHANTDLAEVVAGSDLVVMATPVEFFPDLAARLLEVGGAYVVTDVGSVKGPVHRGAGELLARGGIPFVGAHPMAGSEKGGFAEARATLLQGASCLVTDDGQATESLVAEVAAFWTSLGCRVIEMSPAEHDQVVARISHLPHILAAVGAQVGLRNREEGGLGGGGLRDTTRVAGGDAAMWAGILLENREAVLAEVARASAELGTLQQALQTGSRDHLLAWLQEAKAARDSMASESLVTGEGASRA